jgi:hypothetical protein
VSPSRLPAGVQTVPGEKSTLEVLDSPSPPPFEFNATFQPERLWGEGTAVSCVGGGGTAAFRVAPAWQVIVDVGGCKILGIEANLSGDSLTYMTGPRWVHSGDGPWTAHLQLLVGGNKITQERMFPDKKRLLDATTSQRNHRPPSHADYTEQVEANGIALATGAGVNYKLNAALAIRVAELSYRRSWIGSLGGRDYSHGLKLVSGVVLRIGSW